MSKNPKSVQLFTLLFQLGVLASFSFWGWRGVGGGPLGLTLAVALPVLVIVLWLLFAAPGFSRWPRQALLPTPGWLRCLLEFGLVAIAAYGIWTAGSRAAGETLLTAAGLVLAVSWESVLRLWRNDTTFLQNR